ncbi:hypothetical protein Asppvi_010931 [Aspergillus pseudoviridinutans]|uniref:Hint domain-containing protein n=1 Tax=Aspergillus pseudoviridinutans TaxID=1517512 RepID=A0A9P3BQP4_9EURO|nr:uncharacterized protein Asppvi_010931 [Aspergillus pseudoviridinutans]GIJ91956.1 hypothetical protein Asppvi_010931 [Aspergillus pseudoviridinutans]
MKLQQNFQSHVVLLLLMLLVRGHLASAGAACFPACMVACCECAGGPAAFAGPLGIAVGFTGCTGICMVACATLVWAPPACFANDTLITMFAPNGTLYTNSITAVHAGDEVLTLVNGQLTTTRVVRNLRSSGTYDFMEFEVQSDGVMSTLKVTPQHGLLILDQQGQMRFSFASDVNIGARIPSRNASPWTVSRIKYVSGSEKYTLETTDGSILASDVLVSTICEEEISTGLKMEEIMHDWKSRHQYSFDTTATSGTQIKG